MAHPDRTPPILALAGGTLADLRRLIVPLLWFEVLFKSLVGLLGIAGGSLLLALLVKATGTSAVTNTDLVDFLLSPSGVLILAGLAICTLLASLLEHLGVMAIVARFQRGQALDALGLARAIAGLVPRLLQLKARGLAFLLLTVMPMALLAGLTYSLLLSHHDINYYLADRPPSFIVAVAIGAILGAIFAGLVAYVYVRTVFIFPIMLYEDLPPRAALDESLRRTRGALGRLASILLGWQLVGVLLGAAAISGFTLLAGFLLHLSAERLWALVPLVATLLAAHGLLLAVESFLLVAIHCLLILRLYGERNLALGVPGPAALSDREAPALASLLPYWKAGMLASLGVFVALCVSVFQQFGVPSRVIVTAHKGFSRVAPENSLSSIRKAIEVGAEYAEIDVQATADGEVVLNHDRDLMRVGGVPRRISEMTLADVRSVDIGSRFSPEFAGERVPTLAEVIDLARGRIKLQIELKFYDRDRSLAGKVAGLVERERFEDGCVVSSLNYDGLVEFKRVNPRVRTAAIVTVAIGDIDRLDVDGLSVNARNLSNRLIRAVRARRKDLYAWTVDDPRQMIQLMERGVPNIVTNSPDVLIRLRDELANLNDVERRLLAARYLLGMVPAEVAGATAPHADPTREDP